jgi:hypothetical protein
MLLTRPGKTGRTEIQKSLSQPNVSSKCRARVSIRALRTEPYTATAEAFTVSAAPASCYTALNKPRNPFNRLQLFSSTGSRIPNAKQHHHLASLKQPSPPPPQDHAQQPQSQPSYHPPQAARPQHTSKSAGAQASTSRNCEPSQLEPRR